MATSPIARAVLVVFPTGNPESGILGAVPVTIELRNAVITVNEQSKFEALELAPNIYKPVPAAKVSLTAEIATVEFAGKIPPMLRKKFRKAKPKPPEPFIRKARKDVL